MFNAFFFYFYACYPNFGWNQWQKIRSSEKRRSPVTLDGWVLCFFTNSWGTKPPCFPTIFWETYWTLLGQLGQNLKWFWNFWKGFSQLILESSFKIVVVSCCFICYVHSSKRWSILHQRIFSMSPCHRVLSGQGHGVQGQNARGCRKPRGALSPWEEMMGTFTRSSRLPAVIIGNFHCLSGFLDSQKNILSRYIKILVLLKLCWVMCFFSHWGDTVQSTGDYHHPVVEFCS